MQIRIESAKRVFREFFQCVDQQTGKRLRCPRHRLCAFFSEADTHYAAVFLTAQALSVHVSTASNLLEKLARAGLVERLTQLGYGDVRLVSNGFQHPYLRTPDATTCFQRA